jgi:hypothetical protein
MGHLVVVGEDEVHLRVMVHLKAGDRTMTIGSKCHRKEELLLGKCKVSFVYFSTHASNFLDIRRQTTFDGPIFSSGNGF